MNQYDAILFDVGDTLLIREPPDCDILAERCREAGLLLERATARRAWKQSEIWAGEQILREIHGAPRMPDEEFHQHLDFIALRTAFNDKTADEVWCLTAYLQKIPRRKQAWMLGNGVHETLTKLKEIGFTLGIVSNFDETLPNLCDEFGLTPYFNTIVASSLVGVEKPNPEILRIACRRLGVSPSVSLYVGDHSFDVLCAKEAGMSVAWLCEPSDVLPEQIPYQPNYRICLITDIISSIT